jgi:hypothetical protein
MTRKSKARDSSTDKPAGNRPMFAGGAFADSRCRSEEDLLTEFAHLAQTTDWLMD